MIKHDPQDRDPLTTVVVDIKEYIKLVKARDILAALEAAGVDNWEGYGYAMELLEE